MERLFEAVAEDRPGAKWQSLWARYWPAYRRWFLSEGNRARPLYLSCRRALNTQMPELVPTYDRLVELAGGGDTAARFLSLYCPPPYLSGCSQAVWAGPPPLLARNYDYDPRLLEGVVLRSAWHGRRVLASSDCLWGVLDGLNEDGLAVSLTFGGRRVVGDGFGVPLILRYVLEFCRDTADAVQALTQVTSHMAYNVTALDRGGHYRTLFLSPDRAPVVKRAAVATNHQARVEWHQHAQATVTLERERFLNFRLRAGDGADDLVRAFLRSPVYSTAFDRGFGTLYTAVYRPHAGSAEYLWPNAVWRQSLHQFTEGTRVVEVPAAG